MIEEVLAGEAVPAVRRRHEDGSEHRGVMVFHQANQFVRDLTGWGWTGRVWPVGTNFIAGAVEI